MYFKRELRISTLSRKICLSNTLKSNTVIKIRDRPSRFGSAHPPQGTFATFGEHCVILSLVAPVGWTEQFMSYVLDEGAGAQPGEAPGLKPALLPLHPLPFPRDDLSGLILPTPPCLSPAPPRCGSPSQPTPGLLPSAAPCSLQPTHPLVLPDPKSSHLPSVVTGTLLHALSSLL